MFKIIMSVSAIVLIVSGSAFGFGDNNNSGIQGDKNHHNTIVNGDNVNGGIRNCNINHNHNVNCNKNTNRNTNTNFNSQGQSQNQGQLQGQAQGQGQGQAQGQLNNWSQKFEDKRDLIDSTFIPNTHAELTDHGDASDAKTIGSLWKHVDGMTYEQAKFAGKGASDVDVEKALLFDTDYRTTYINKGKSGQFMGYIYILPSGSDCTLAQMEARALKEAMYAGANFALLFMSEGKYLSGSAWNIGLSGGASAMAKGDDIAINPNGGLGFGKAYSNNEVRPAIIVALYLQEDLIFEKIERVSVLRLEADMR